MVDRGGDVRLPQFAGRQFSGEFEQVCRCCSVAETRCFGPGAQPVRYRLGDGVSRWDFFRLTWCFCLDSYFCAADLVVNFLRFLVPDSSRQSAYQASRFLNGKWTPCGHRVGMAAFLLGFCSAPFLALARGRRQRPVRNTTDFGNF